jgi:hypothetical protein
MSRDAARPSKTCAACGRTFAWRRKWAADWEQVRYCSKACRDGRYTAARAVLGRTKPREGSG